MKRGDKVWVLCLVLEVENDSVLVCGNADKSWWVRDEDCKPIEPYRDDNPVVFKVGDKVVSRCGREGVVEAIDLIEGYPITVRHSIREQVSYLVCDVRHRN
jgi:hypothetical protein